MPILYDCSTAPSPRRARILLAEKGVAHDTVQIDLRSGEQLGDAYPGAMGAAFSHDVSAASGGIDGSRRGRHAAVRRPSLSFPSPLHPRTSS